MNGSFFYIIEKFVYSYQPKRSRERMGSLENKRDEATF